MGIYDREYYRKEGPSYLDGLIPSGNVCKWLIITNIIVFILQLMLDNRRGGPTPIEDYFALHPADVISGQVWQLLTYAFLHDTGGLMHILFNMLFLWWFGSDMEKMYGSREFLAFYLISALLGGIAFTAIRLAQGSPALCVGASGAVTAVMVLFAFHFPNRKILLFFILPIPIWMLVAFNVAQDSFQFFGGHDNGIAVSVHLAGAAFAALYFKRRWHLMGIWDRVRSLKPSRRASGPRLRVYNPEKEEPEAVSVSSSSSLDEQFEAKLDAVLAKVASSGQESLTDSERQILMRASEIYKKKRT